VETLVLILHILVALGMIGLILLQQGKGAEAGASFAWRVILPCHGVMHLPAFLFLTMCLPDGRGA